MEEEVQQQPTEETGGFDWYTAPEEEDTLAADHLLYTEEESVPADSGTGAVQAQGQEAQPAAQKNVDWQKRYTDLQSYHDRSRTQWEQERTQVSQKLSEYEQLKALRDVIVSDPNLLGTVEAVLSGRDYPVQGQQNPLPAPPPDFDPMDALNPSTPSGQYYQAVLQQQIRSTVGDVQSLPQTVTQQVLSVMEQRERQKMQEEQQRQRDAAVRQEFETFEQSHPELTPEAKEMFLDFLAKGPQALGQQRLSLEHLYMLFGALSQAQTQAPVQQEQPRQSPQDMLASKIRQVQQSAVPPNVTQIPAGVNTQPLTDDDYFNSSLAKRRGPRWTIGK